LVSDLLASQLDFPLTMLLAVEKFQAVLFDFGKSQAQPFRPFTKRVSYFIHRKIPGKGTNNLHMVLAPVEFVGDWLDKTHRVPPVQPALLPRGRKLLMRGAR